MRDVIRCIVDDSDFLEIQELWAANICDRFFGRMAGETVGFVANQPMVLAGVLDCDSADKAARFIRFCDSFNIPISSLEEYRGYLFVSKCSGYCSCTKGGTVRFSHHAGDFSLASAEIMGQEGPLHIQRDHGRRKIKT